jgi:hypothetical protein
MSEKLSEKNRALVERFAQSSCTTVSGLYAITDAELDMLMNAARHQAQDEAKAASVEEERTALRLAAKLLLIAVNNAEVESEEVQVAAMGLRSALSPAVAWSDLFAVLADGVSPMLIAEARALTKSQQEA